MNIERKITASFVILFAGLYQACSLEAYKKDADREAYSIIREKQKKVLGKEVPFTVESLHEKARQSLLEEIERARKKDGTGVKPLKLDLKKTLEAASFLSREFQDLKEILFLAALDLSTKRWEFKWHPSVSGDIGVSGNRRRATTSGRVSATLQKTLGIGASILAGLLNSFSRTITSGGPWNTSSLFSLSITQPLLRGFGRRIVLEPLTQAERNVVYAIRNFERSRRNLVVRITTQYFRLLQQMAQIEVEKENLKTLEKNLERNQALEKAGKLAKLQVDQNRQSVLVSRARLLDARESFRTALDNFKIMLGIPVDVDIELEKNDFEKLKEKGIALLPVTVEKAIAIAVERRLDLRNSMDMAEDAKRKVYVAADALKMGLDLDLDLDIPSRQRKPGKPAWRDTTMGAGLSFDLPIDRIPQRNAYRRAIVSYEQAVRRMELKKENIIQEIRERFRRLKQASQEYEIQLQGVKLAKRRVDETTMKQQAGRAIVRDVLEAQDALRSAQNALDRAMVDFLTARLELLRDMEILKLSEEGLGYDERIDFAKILEKKK